MEIRHVVDRAEEGTVRDVFVRRAERGFPTARELLVVLDLLEQQSSEMAAWAYEGYGHLVLTFSSTSGKPLVSIVNTDQRTFTVYGNFPKPVSSIAHKGEVFYRGLNASQAAEVAVGLLDELRQ